MSFPFHSFTLFRIGLDEGQVAALRHCPWILPVDFHGQLDGMAVVHVEFWSLRVGAGVLNAMTRPCAVAGLLGACDKSEAAVMVNGKARAPRRREGARERGVDRIIFASTEAQSSESAPHVHVIPTKT